MEKICVADVGDGLCMGIHFSYRDKMQIDCGSTNGYKYALKGYQWLLNTTFKPNSFVLSHLHKDHYNGLLKIPKAKLSPTIIDRVYYPKVPEFSNKDEFLRDICCMNLFLLGEDTGIMEYDLLDIITNLNKGVRPRNIPLWKGKSLYEGGRSFDVLWPPETLTDTDILGVIEKAISDFKAALDVDPELQDLYGRITEEGAYRKYGETEGRRYEGEGINSWRLRERRRKRKLPDQIKRANKSLREAANHLSLSFMLDQQFLFLGDLEKKEIGLVMSDLLNRLNRNFGIIITPHHGTHHHPILELLSCDYSISSVGKRLCRHLEPNYKKISLKHYTTWTEGNITIFSYPYSLLFRERFLF